MGSLITKNVPYCTDSGAPLFSTNKPITASISNAIKNEMKMEELLLFPDELMAECLEFIGFFLFSSILSERETLCLHLLLLSHHKKREIRRNSPLCPGPKYRHRLKYYDLLYRSSINGENGKYTNKSFKNALDEAYRLNKSNLVIIYHTGFDHIFAVYLHKRLKQNQNGDFMPNLDRDLAICLLRPTQRLIQLRSQCMNYSQYFWSNEKKIHIAEIDFVYARDPSEYTPKQIKIFTKFGLKLDEKYTKSSLTDLDVSRQELIGDESRFFPLKQVEVYQIL